MEIAVSEPMLTGTWSAMMNHLPHASVLLLAVFPLIGVAALRLMLASKSAAKAREPKQWVLLRGQDAEGIPLLAEGCTVRQRQPVKVRQPNPNYRRSDF
jgi:hypothetical protein